MAEGPVGHFEGDSDRGIPFREMGEAATISCEEDRQRRLEQYQVRSALLYRRCYPSRPVRRLGGVDDRDDAGPP